MPEYKLSGYSKAKTAEKAGWDFLQGLLAVVVAAASAYLFDADNFNGLIALLPTQVGIVVALALKPALRALQDWLAHKD